MGRSHARKRKMAIKQKIRVKKKLGKLRSKYRKIENTSQKEKILEKVFKISPNLSKKEFLAVKEKTEEEPKEKKDSETKAK